jgi:glycosyl transferase family 25
MNYSEISITTFSVGNLGTEFQGKKEFDLCPVDNRSNRWISFLQIVKDSYQGRTDDVIIICYEGHHFTRCYQHEVFVKNIMRGADLGTQIMIGGCNSFSNLVPIFNGLYWIDRFSHSNFYVVYRSAFPAILETKPEDGEELECLLSCKIANKLLLNPFISSVNENNEAEKQIEIYNRIVSKYNILML